MQRCQSALYLGASQPGEKTLPPGSTRRVLRFGEEVVDAVIHKLGGYYSFARRLWGRRLGFLRRLYHQRLSFLRRLRELEFGAKTVDSDQHQALPTCGDTGSLTACGVRKVGSCGDAVLVDESAEAVATLDAR